MTFELPPSQWPIAQPMTQQRRVAPAAVYWRAGKRSLFEARLNKAATELADSIKAGANGVIVRIGTGKDRGMFALEFTTWEERNDTSVKLRAVNGTSSATRFAAGTLCAVKPTGNSLLERHGDLLVGHFSGRESQKARPRARRHA